MRNIAARAAVKYRQVEFFKNKNNIQIGKKIIIKSAATQKNMHHIIFKEPEIFDGKYVLQADMYIHPRNTWRIRSALVRFSA